MAQGAIKKTKSASTPSSKGNKSKPAVLGPKRGPRSIAPKKEGLIKKKKLDKKLSAGLTARTERSLANKAGHLEILKGGKKEGKGKDGEGKKGKKA